MNHDEFTTILGCLLGALITANVDWAKVLAYDNAEIGKIIAAVVIVAYGWSTNKLPTGKP